MFVPHPGKQFPEKATQDSGDSPGVLEGPPPPVRGVGLGKAPVFIWAYGDLNSCAAGGEISGC